MGDELTLLGVQEDGPLIPRRVQSAFQFLDARHGLDFTLSFHVGATARILALSRGAPADAQKARLTPAWRRWEQAAETPGCGRRSRGFSGGRREVPRMPHSVRSIARKTGDDTGLEDAPQR